MPKLIPYSYRQTPTSEGLKKIEEGKLELFDAEMFSNFNTGTLEQYLDEKHREKSFGKYTFVWHKIALGIMIGMAFAIINQYVGLKVGLITGGAWYIAYLLGLALRWNPNHVNLASCAATGADRTCTGFVFTFPAIYLLAYHATYIGVGGSKLIYPEDIGPIVPIAISSALIAGLLGIMYFIIFRRIWLVEDPLPVPGFQASIKLMDIANDLSKGALEQAKKSIKIVGIVSGGMMLFTFLRDFPIYKKYTIEGKEHTNLSILDSIFGMKYYAKGTVMQPYDTAYYTQVGFTLTGIQLALGWFMKFRSALLISIGTIFSWLVIMPMAVFINVPVYVPKYDGFLPLQNEYFWYPEAYITPGLVAYTRIVRIIAIGAILGGGITALLKMAPVFKTVTEDVRRLGKGERKDFVKGKGWYEWPVTHIWIMVVVAFLGIGIIFYLGGFPPHLSFVFSLVLVFVAFFLGAIAIKVMGETGVTPVSGTTFITLIFLFLIFMLLGAEPKVVLIMALVGSTVFAIAISLSADITSDFKIGLYCGTRPYHLIKAESAGIICGTIVSGVGATIFSYGLAIGQLDLLAPQAHAFATFSQVLAGGAVRYELLFLGIGIGVFAELMTGMGTAFGLGMYLYLSYALPLLLGGGLRDFWEKKMLEPKAKKENWDERKKTFKLLETYMVATGLLVGEAILGTIIAIYILAQL